MPRGDDDDEEEWEYSSWEEQDVTERDTALWVTFEPQEALFLELPDGSYHEWWPGFGFTRDR
jgi:hypothetical protein